MASLNGLWNALGARLNSNELPCTVAKNSVVWLAARSSAITRKRSKDDGGFRLTRRFVRFVKLNSRG
jgi:hypothetical protein